MQTGDVVLVQGTGWQAWLIRLCTGSPWTHAAIAVDEQYICEITDNYRVQIVPLHYKNIRILRLRQGLTPEQRASMLRWCQARLGDGYNWGSIIAIALRILTGIHAAFDQRRRYICTEIITGAYQAAGIDLITTGEPLAPVELMNLPALGRGPSRTWRWQLVSYPDVPPDAWYARYVEVATALGLLQGDPEGTFRPSSPVTRAELATVVARLAENDLVLRNWASQRLRSQVAPAVVHIRAGQAIGSGVVVHPAGWVATCLHVTDAAGSSTLSCQWPDWPGSAGAGPDLDVVATDPTNDLALCRVYWPAQADAWAFPWVKLAASRDEPAEPVVMLGSPAGVAGWESHGLIARPEVVIPGYQGNPQNLVCISGAVNPGNSGGALIRASDGTLLGIVDAKLVDVAIEAMAFAVPISAVRDLMETAGVVWHRQP